MKSFDEYFNEAKLSVDDRNEMDDSDFGIPETRSFPLKGKNEEDTKTHITQAMRMFPHADARYKDALAKRILRAAKAHGIDTSNWKIDKRYNKPIKESVSPEDDTSGTSKVVTIETLNPDIKKAVENFDDLWSSRDEYFKWFTIIDEIAFSSWHSTRGHAITADDHLYEDLVLSNDTIHKSHEYIKKFNLPNIDNLVPFARLLGSLKTYQDKFFYVDNDTLDVYYWTNFFSDANKIYHRKPDKFEKVCKLNEFGKYINSVLSWQNLHTVFIGDDDIPKHLPIVIGWNEEQPLFAKEVNTYPYSVNGKKIVYIDASILRTIINEYNSGEYDEGITWALGNEHVKKIFDTICKITGKDYSDVVSKYEADKYDHMRFAVIYDICDGNIQLNVFAADPFVIFYPKGCDSRVCVRLYGGHSYSKCQIWTVVNGKTQFVESVGPEDDDTSGTSEFDEYNVNEPDDCYVESKNDSIHMRPATKADADRMYRWEMESIDKELQKDPKVQKLIREDVEQSIKDTQMIMDGRVTIGMFTACMIDDGEWRYIGEIYLIPSYRGRGIGSGILRKEIEQYPKIRLQVATSNDKAIKLYKSLGFKIVKENKKQKMYVMEYTRDAVQESKTNIPMKKVSILYKRWCVDNGEQYEKIARFWDIVEQYVNCDYLQGYGTAWTSDNGGYFTYGIIFKKGTIPNNLVSAVKREFPDMKVSNTYSVPSKYDHTFNGKTKDIDALYDKIWSKGPLAYELEECRSDGTCSIHVIYKADITQEGFFNRKKSEPPEPCELYKQFEDAYNDETFTSIIKTFKNQKSSLLAGWLHKTLGDDDYVTDDMVDGNVGVFLSKQQLNDIDMTDRNYNTIGYGFAYVNNPDEWLSISMTDGKVYYCGDAKALEYSENVVADSFNEFLASFGDVFKSYLKGKPIQEGVIQNIKNKTSPFEKNLVYHISPEGHLDGQIFKPRVPDYLDKYDPSKTEFEDVETPRVCFSPSIEGCLNAIIVNIGRWKTAEKLRDWYVYIPEKPLKEYKYRTNKQLVDEKKVYDANLTKEIWIEEPVRLKQYGVIRIDSVVDKSRKKAVPTTLGESKKRNVYDFKWHWLVKPKVLKDVPYDYSPLEVCKDMVADLERYKYGIPENGRIVNGSEHDYDTKWKLQSPEEFEKNRGGICYDYVEFEEGYLDAYGIECKKYYMSTNLPGNDTHTFIVVDDGKGGYIYPESSFKDFEGVHEAKSIDEILKMVANGFWKINNNKKNRDSFEWHVWEYTGHPKYGSNMKQCMEYYSKGEPKYEGVCKDDDPKPKVTSESAKPDELIPIKESYQPLERNRSYFRNFVESVHDMSSYASFEDDMFEEYMLSDEEIYTRLYQEYTTAYQEEVVNGRPSLGRRILNAIISVLRWLKNAVLHLVEKVKRFIARRRKKKNINDIAATVIGEGPVQEAYITADQMNGRKQKRQSIDYMDRRGMTSGKLVDDLYIEVINSGTIVLQYMKQSGWQQQVQTSSDKNSKHYKTINSSVQPKSLHSPWYDIRSFIAKFSNLKEFEDGANEIIRDFESNRIDYKKIRDYTHIFGRADLATDKVTISVKDLMRYQSIMNKLLDAVSKYADDLTTEVAPSELQDLRQVLINDQMGVNILTSHIVLDADTISPKYQHKIKTIEKLSQFVDACIKSGIPPKIFMYNTWLACAKNLSVGDKYKPVSGMSRFVLFPADKSSVIKIGYNGFGIMSNRNEANITELIKGTDIAKYFALIKSHNASYSVVEQERVYNDSDECEQLKDAIVQHDWVGGIVSRISGKFEELQKHKHKAITRLEDLHSGNVFCDTHNMIIRFVDYGYTSKKYNVNYKSNKPKTNIEDDVKYLVNAIHLDYLKGIDEIEATLKTMVNSHDLEYVITTIDNWYENGIDNSSDLDKWEYITIYMVILHNANINNTHTGIVDCIEKYYMKYLRIMLKSRIRGEYKAIFLRVNDSFPSEKFEQSNKSSSSLKTSSNKLGGWSAL